MGNIMTKEQKQSLKKAYSKRLKELDNINEDGANKKNPSVEEFNQCYYGEGLNNIYFSDERTKVFSMRAIPVSMGMLAELYNNPDLDLEDLNDCTSEKAIESKKNAGKLLSEIFNTKEGLDVEKINKFYSKASSIFLDKMSKVIESMGNDNSKIRKYTENNALMLDGIWDCLAQQMAKVSWDKTGWENNDFEKAFAKVQAVKYFFDLHTISVEQKAKKYLESKSETRFSDDTEFINVFMSNSIQKGARELANKAFDLNGYEGELDNNKEGVYKTMDKIPDIRGMVLVNDIINYGILSKLDDIELAIITFEDGLLGHFEIVGTGGPDVNCYFDGIDMKVMSNPDSITEKEVDEFRKKFYATISPDTIKMFDNETKKSISKYLPERISKLDNRDVRQLSNKLSVELNELNERTQFGRSSSEYRSMVKATTKLVEETDKIDVNNGNEVEELRNKLEDAVKKVNDYLKHKGVGIEPKEGEKFKNEYETKRIEQARSIGKILSLNLNTLNNLIDEKNITEDNLKLKDDANNINKLFSHVKANYDKHEKIREERADVKNYIDSENMALEAGKKLVLLVTKPGELTEEDKLFAKDCMASMCVPYIHYTAFTGRYKSDPDNIAATVPAEKMKKSVLSMHIFQEEIGNITKESIEEFITNHGPATVMRHALHTARDLEEVTTVEDEQPQNSVKKADEPVIGLN